VERAAEGDGDRFVAVPGELDDGCFHSGGCDRGRKSCLAGGSVEHDVGARLPVPASLPASEAARHIHRRGGGEARAERLDEAAPCFGGVDDVTSRPAVGCEVGDEQATIPAPTTTMRSAGPAPESHSALRAVSMLAAIVARRAGSPRQRDAIPAGALNTS